MYGWNGNGEGLLDLYVEHNLYITDAFSWLQLIHLTADVQHF